MGKGESYEETDEKNGGYGNVGDKREPRGGDGMGITPLSFKLVPRRTLRREIDHFASLQSIF